MILSNILQKQDVRPYGPVGVGIIRRFARLGEGDNYGFFPHFRDVNVAVEGVEKQKDVFLVVWGEILKHFIVD
jgi:hypothetical protein